MTQHFVFESVPGYSPIHDDREQIKEPVAAGKSQRRDSAVGDGVQSINSKQIVHLPLSQLIVMLNRIRLKQIQQVTRGWGTFSVL